MSEWFTSLANQALKFADDIADSLVAQANEAQSQLQEEQRRLKEEEERRKETKTTNQLLPWETLVESRQILSKSLMESILTLSLNEKNFSIASPNAVEFDFYMPDFAPTAMKMIELDSNLARVHAKLSPKMNEEHFWFNYYCRIMYLRAASGIDGVDAQKSCEKYRREEVIAPSSDSNIVKPAAKIVTPLTKSNIQATYSPASQPPAGSVSDTNSTKKTFSSPVMVDNFSLDGMNLDLDDLKDLELLEEELGEDFENIASNAGEDEDELDDADLEAQIAKELGEM